MRRHPPLPAGTAPPAGRRRRDRHGRGMRGPLAPPAVPISLTRAERFDELVRQSLERLEGRWARELATVELAVDDVPPREAADAPGPGTVPLGRFLRGEGDAAPRIVVYRRPLERRALDQLDLEDLVHEVLVEQVAEMLGLDPRAVDPDYDGD